MVKETIEEQEKECVKCAECMNGWKRAQADLANYRADERKRFEEFAKFSQEALLRDLISGLVSLNLAVKSTPEGDAKKGMLLIRSQLEETMRTFGLERISAKAGDAFDPKLHEALASAKPPEGTQAVPDSVLHEIESGYALHGKTIKPARVIVAE